MNDGSTLNGLPLDYLRTFVAASEQGGFTAAGRIVHRTQAAVSMQIKKLETELGRELFLREKRGVRLTESGELLLGYARRMLELHDEALSVLVGPDLSGTVRLGAPEDYAGQSLTEALVRFAGAHPRVLVELHCDTSPRLLEDLQTGKLDLTLASGTDVEQRVAAGGRQILRAPLVWVVGRGFETQLKRPLPLAVFQKGCPYRAAAEAALDRAGISWRAAFSSPSLSGALAAVRAGLGVTPMPGCLSAPGCRRLGEEDGLPDIADTAVTLHQAVPGGTSPAAALLAALLEESFGKAGQAQKTGPEGVSARRGALGHCLAGQGRAL
ncbi:MAG: LysR substrate-binding domain-containing protein [Desulfovibrio sp.]